ncbi:MAG TPA: autotransporter-associated beta strand repeat-containing protein, partial [Burkholderiales bacterium]|nr:autotransporter-associated beta strand repeat-containing protein [Burkholderiales bacterium]
MEQRPFQRRLIQIAVASCFATAAYGNPTGPSVVSGAATFNAVGKNLTITNAPGAIINWQGFSIRADEVTRFVQSGAASAVLNRVTGAEQSQLLGQLLSNGRVFLINPNGVTVGAGSVIDTAGFVASSLNLSNEDFLAGKFRFTDPGNAGKVVNAGTINAHSGGFVYLVAPTVENHGVITAPNGDVMLAAGKSVELVSAASPDLRVHVQAGGEALNLGRLLAESGRVGIYGAAVRNGGQVSADSAQLTATGTVILKASKDVTLDATGTITANGPHGGLITVQAETGTLLADGKIEARGSVAGGGDVRLLGEQVGLVNQAAVDASGRTGGGTVLVGGDYQGRNRDVPNARATYVGPDATITADATNRGDGGRVIVWADETTQFYGTIAARGGASGGNGGFVETSGHNLLEARGMVNTLAPAGAAGMWLLDPTDLSVTTTANVNVTGATPFQPTGAGSVLTWATIDGALAGSNVVVQTTAGFNAGQPGNITIVNPYTYNRANSLTFTAANNIVQNAGADIQNNGAGALNFTASGTGTVTLNANVTTTNGAITVTAPGGFTQAAGTTINTGGNSLTVNVGAASAMSGVLAGAGTSLVKQGVGGLLLAGANTYTGATTISAGTVVAANNAALGTAAGATTVAAGAELDLGGAGLAIAEPLTLNGTGVSGGGALRNLASNNGVTGAITLATASRINSDGGTLTISGAGNVTGALPLTVGGAGDTTISKVIATGAGTLTKDGAGTLTLSGANTYTGATTINAGTLSVANATGLGTVAGGATVNAGGTLNINGVPVGAEPVTLNGAGVGGNGALTGTGAASLSGAITLASATTIGASAAGTLTLSGAMNGANALTLVGPGRVVLNGAVGGVTPLASVTQQAGNALTIGANITTTGNQTYGDAVTVGANTTLNAGAGDIAFNNTVNGAFALTANSTGTTTFGGAVGGTTALASLTTNAGGTTAINGGAVTTTGAQTYNDAVTLGANTTLNAGAGAINFANTLNGGFALTANSTGATTFGGVVGGVTPLASLTTNAGGTTAINGGAVTTTGAQTYGDAVTVGANTTFVSTGGGNVAFMGTLNSAGANRAVTVNTGGTTTFGGVVGGALALASLTTDAAGSTSLGANVTTNNGPVSFGDNVTLTGASTIAAGTGAIGFGGTVNGAFALTANT